MTLMKDKIPGVLIFCVGNCDIKKFMKEKGGK